MAAELRWVLIVISIVIIGGLLVHGLWSVRKKESSVMSAKERVEPLQETPSHSPHVESDLSDERDEPQFGELNFDANDSHIDMNVPDAPLEVDIDEHDAPQTKTNNETQAPVSDFVIVHIQMPEGLTMQGSKLLPSVNTLGFKYSDEGFFNRHIDPAGQGPVLFRLVNMYNPGTFDIDNMEQLSTAGISLFMTLPCDGDGFAAFNMLHSAAKRIADEFGAQILDAERNEMTVERVRQYIEQVRSFSA